MSAQLSIPFRNSYALLPNDFYVKLCPEKMPNLQLIRLNKSLCKLLNFLAEDLETESGVNFLGGLNISPNSEPLAQAYAGHQFGNFVDRLGDGRAILLGEVIGSDGITRDIQIKGSGRTPFSRMGDGRAALGPVLREYIVSEAMAGFGIPTTRALAALLTGETILREKPLPGALLTRVAKSHIRVGTFEYFSSRGETRNVKILADYVIKRHYPHLSKKRDKYDRLLTEVVQKQAILMSKWMSVGFIHGVMNTDNTAISGETIDFGPCAFMDKFNVNQVYSSIDLQGRYRYSNQPFVAPWNLSRLAETLLPIIDKNKDKAIKSAQEIIDSFIPAFLDNWILAMGSKLGIKNPQKEDKILIENLMKLMQDGKSDFTLTFRSLSKVIEKNSCESWEALFSSVPASKLTGWVEQWQKRLVKDSLTKTEIIQNLNNTNPAIIPRNHLIENCIKKAEEGDLSDFHKLADAVETPFEEKEEYKLFSRPPKPEEEVQHTYCGT